jgi:hypothetical protein
MPKSAKSQNKPKIFEIFGKLFKNGRAVASLPAIPPANLSLAFMAGRDARPTVKQFQKYEIVPTQHSVRKQ